MRNQSQLFFSGKIGNLRSECLIVRYTVELASTSEDTVLSKSKMLYMDVLLTDEYCVAWYWNKSTKRERV